MRVRHLFSGGGNDAWGFRKAGMSIVDMAEARPERRDLLRQMYPEATIHDDVRTMDERAIDLVAGGPPCQRTSVASAIFGKRTGETLWPAMFRHCLESKWVVVEQPPGNKAWETQVKTDLEGSGFHARRLEYAASDLGAPHIRRRVFILAHRDMSRLEVAWRSVPSEIERFARGGAAGNPWLTYPPRGLRVADGLAGTPRTAGARDAIEMLGDGIPWPMTYVLARAILESGRLSEGREVMPKRDRKPNAVDAPPVWSAPPTLRDDPLPLGADDVLTQEVIDSLLDFGDEDLGYTGTQAEIERLREAARSVIQAHTDLNGYDGGANESPERRIALTVALTTSLERLNDLLPDEELTAGRQGDGNE